MNMLVVDIGGTNVKILATGQAEPLKFPPGPKMTPLQMVSGVKELAGSGSTMSYRSAIPVWFIKAAW